MGPIRTIITLLAVVLLPGQLWAQMPRGFVDAATVVDGLIVDMRYFGDGNFVGARIDGYLAPRCILTQQAAAALANVQRELASYSLGLKVFDCYRPTRAVAHFVRWARDLKDVRTKADYYPNVDKRMLFALGYISTQSGHSRGSTIDLTLVRRVNGQSATELDLGTPFDFFGPQSWPSSRLVSDAARENRRLLANAMRRGGFYPYQQEWWHFTLRGEPFPGRYFNFVVE
jgi:D-alanyl-D-alanine dipeptidase